MALLIDSYITLEKLETLVKTLKINGMKGVGITIAVNDEFNEYGKNVSGYITQTKEEREAKKPRYYVLNGKVVWSDGKVEQPKQKQNEEEKANELPF